MSSVCYLILGYDLQLLSCVLLLLRVFLVILGRILAVCSEC